MHKHGDILHEGRRRENSTQHYQDARTGEPFSVTFTSHDFPLVRRWCEDCGEVEVTRMDAMFDHVIGKCPKCGRYWDEERIAAEIAALGGGKEE